MRSLAILVVATMLSGCGATATESASAPASASTSNAGALRLGHYSSGDGMVGFVLDRTGSVPKVRIDGTSEVLTLEVRRTSQRSFDLVNHEKHIGLSIDDEGRVTFSRAGGGPNKEMFRDANAAPL